MADILPDPPEVNPLASIAGGTLGGITIDPALLTGTQYAELQQVNSFIYPRWYAYTIACVTRAVNIIPATSGSTQGSNPIGASEQIEFTPTNPGVAITLPNVALYFFGKTIVLHNVSANALLVFPFSNQLINALGYNQSVSLPAATTMRFTTVSVERWRSW